MAGEPGTFDNVIEFRSPRAREEFSAYVAMLIFLGSWVMMFSGLFMAYELLKARAEVWPPAGEPVLLLSVPLLTTVFMLATSCLYHLGYLAVRRREQARALYWLLGSLVSGLGVVVAQAAGWSILWKAGLTPWRSPYGSLVYTLTVVHAAHVLVGAFASAYLCVRVRQGLLNAARFLPLRLWGLYWHSVGLVWVILFFVVSHLLKSF